MSWQEIKGKNKDQLLQDICGGSEPGSKIFEHLREAILVESARDVETAVNRLRVSNEQIAASNDSLGKKVFWLNVVLAIATVVGSAATLLQAWVALYK